MSKPASKSDWPRFLLCIALVVAGLVYWQFGSFGGAWQFVQDKLDHFVDVKNDAHAEGPILGSSNPSYDAIDQHALKATADAEKDIAGLAAYLVRPAKSEVHKARAIYRWITDRITYDLPAYEAFLAEMKSQDSSWLPKMGSYSVAVDVLKARKAVCAGFAQLFKALCQEAKVEAVIIGGHARTRGQEPGQPFDPNHAWNAVKLQGRWYLVDTTWGGGAVSLQSKTPTKKYTDYYFLTPPEQLIFSHFPAKEAHQFLDSAVAREVFQTWRPAPHELFQCGVAPTEVRSCLNTPGFRAFVEMNQLTPTAIKKMQAPLTRHLKAGQAYLFRFEAPACSNIACIQNGTWHKLTYLNNAWEGSIQPTPGKMQILAQFRAKDGKFWSILDYQVD